MDMVHSDIFPKAIVKVDVKPNEVKHDVKLDKVNDGVQLEEE